MLNLAMPEADIQVSTMNGLVLLTGTVKAPEDAAEAERLVQAFVGKDTQVVSRLRSATPLQVNLQVKISDVSRNRLNKIGTNFTSIDSSGGEVRGSIGPGNRVSDSLDVVQNLWTYQHPADRSPATGRAARKMGIDVGSRK